MNINKDFKETIVKEIKFVVKKMDQSETGEQKLYYFSAIYGILQRIFNLEYDPDLIYMHFVLQNTLEAFSGRLQTIIKGKERIIQLNEDHFKKLTQITKELARKIQKNEDVSETLKRFVVLSYTTTGNGHYLMQKGLLKIKDI